MSDDHSVFGILSDVSLIRGGRGSSSGEMPGPATVSASDLRGKVLLLYFSASWCPPCRKFTPVLAGLYDKLKKKESDKGGGSGEDFEIIFVSRDDYEAKHDEYTEEMPWLVVPFEHKAKRDELAKKYEAKTIPHLVVIDSDGESVITEDGMGKVKKDGEGNKFPWRPPPFSQIWSDGIIGRDGAIIPSSDLRDKYLVFYFGASWCPPCRRFTPILNSAYDEMKSGPFSDAFELAFVSADKSKSLYDEYRAEMTFPAVEFGEKDGYGEEQARKGCLVLPALAKRLNVREIPTLVILGPENERGDRGIINKDAKDVVERGELDGFENYLFQRLSQDDGPRSTLTKMQSVRALN